jgi:hypothetical protein
MKEPSADRLKPFERVPGVLACGLLLADQTCSCLSFEPSFSPECLQNACLGIADTIRTLTRQGLPPSGLQWFYEHFLLHCRQGPESSCLVLFCSRKPRQLDAAALERQITEFQAIGS